MKKCKAAHRNQYRMIQCIAVFVFAACFNCMLPGKAMAQEKKQMVRLAKIKVDPSQLEQYNAALKEQMATAIRTETGVLTFYAMADNADPSSITILEIYADKEAYLAHIQTAHFKKYKDTVKDMVKHLELVDVTLLGVAKKLGR